MSEFLVREGMFAIYGVVAGVALTWVGEFIRLGFERNRRARYLAIRSVIALDTFVGKCAEALTSDPEVPPNTNPDDVFDMPDTFQIPGDVDWTSISHDLAYRILSIPQRDTEAREAVSFIFRVADGAQASDTRDEYYIALGLDAANIANDLRNKYNLVKAAAGKWDPVKILDDLNQKRKIDSQAGAVS